MGLSEPLFFFSLGQGDNTVLLCFKLHFKIEEKLRKRHEILAKKNKGNGKMDILSRYMSIVSIGLNIPITEIKQYTVYELFDNYKRAQLKDEFDLYVKRATSFGGVKKDEKVVNWQKNLNDNSDD